jgi:hypothetical protein
MASKVRTPVVLNKRKVTNIQMLRSRQRKKYSIFCISGGNFAENL